MYTYKLTRIVFKDGTAIEPGSLTVIIGPNNAGKSRVLKDIVAKTTGNTQNQNIPGVVVDDIEWTLPQSIQKLHETYNIERYREEHGSWTFRTLAPELSQEFQTSIGLSPGVEWLDWFDEQFQSQETNKYQFFAEHFGRAMVAFLTNEGQKPIFILSMRTTSRLSHVSRKCIEIWVYVVRASSISMS